MTRKLNILVAGGYDSKDPTTLSRPVEEIRGFVNELGREIMDQGHTLLTGCRTELDKQVAESAEARLLDRGTRAECEARIVSYVNQGLDPCHDIGSIRQSELADWELGGKDLNPPEIIRDADASVIGGSEIISGDQWGGSDESRCPLGVLQAGAGICLHEAAVATLYTGI
jgi:hypothetical protein